jgi:hypothetical protein
MGSRPTWAAQHDPASKTQNRARCQWLTPIILATQEAEVRRIKI